MKLLSAASFSLLLTGAMSENCPPELTQSMTLNTNAGNTLTFNYEVILSSLSDNMSLLCAQLQSDAGGYIVFGTSPTGTMQDGEAIIGIPDDAEGGDPGTVMKYYLSTEYPRTVQMPYEHQSLRDTQITKENGNTIMTFSKLLREQEQNGERAILANGENTFLWVLGADSDLGYFPDDEVGTFSLDFEITRPPTSSAITPAPSFGGIDVAQGMARTLSPTGGYIRRDEPGTASPSVVYVTSPPAPTPNTVVSVSSPSDTISTEQDDLELSTPDDPYDAAATVDSPSGAMIRKTIGNMILGSGLVLWLI